MTPVDVFNAVKNVTGGNTVILCDMHKHCEHLRCGNESKIQQIDFDKVKRIWCKNHGKPSCSSVDGLTYTTDTLYMMEMKGTIEFLQHQRNTSSSIQYQMQRYDLQKKLSNSIGLCEEIVGVKDLCLSMKVVFLLVTDVDPEKDAITALAQQLDILATTSTDWEKVYTDTLANHMSNQLMSLHNIKSHFIFCQKFDDYIQ